MQHICHVPPDELVQNINVFLQVIRLRRLLGIGDRERRSGCSVLDIGSTGLEQISRKEEVVEGIDIFEKLESRSSLN